MDEKKLHLDAPFLSVRRNPTKSKIPSESENTKKKTTRRINAKDSCQETEHETLVRLLQDDQTFDHVMEASSVPFLWEQTPGKPKNHMVTTLVEEADRTKALDMDSSTASLGVSEFKDNRERLCNVSRDDVIIESRDLIMSRFLPATEAIAMKQKKESSQVEEKRKKKQSIILQRVSMAINQDLNNDNDDDYENNHLYSNVSKKTLFGLCSKNSLDVLNPVLSRVKTCQNLGVLSGKIVNPKSLDSVRKINSASLPRILRSNQVMSKYQELYPTPRFSTEISKISQAKSGKIIRIPRNLSGLQRTTSTDQIQRQETRFLAEEVRKRKNINKIRSGNLNDTSQISDSQPPLPKTPSESWLCRVLPRGSAASVVSGPLAGSMTNPRTINWETIVKTSYKHYDHVRYSQELRVVHPSCGQHKS